MPASHLHSTKKPFFEIKHFYCTKTIWKRHFKLYSNDVKMYSNDVKMYSNDVKMDWNDVKMDSNDVKMDKILLSWWLSWLYYRRCSFGWKKKCWFIITWRLSIGRLVILLLRKTDETTSLLSPLLGRYWASFIEKKKTELSSSTFNNFCMSWS